MKIEYKKHFIKIFPKLARILCGFIGITSVFLIISTLNQLAQSYPTTAKATDEVSEKISTSLNKIKTTLTDQFYRKNEHDLDNSNNSMAISNKPSLPDQEIQSTNVEEIKNVEDSQEEKTPLQNKSPTIDNNTGSNLIHVPANEILANKENKTVNSPSNIKKPATNKRKLNDNAQPNNIVTKDETDSSEWRTVFSENFEGNLSDNWTFGDWNSNNGLDYWGTSRKDGSYSAYCSGNGDTGSGHRYDNYMNSYLFWTQNIDASSWNSSKISFDIWRQAEEDEYYYYDYMDVMAWNSSAGEWEHIGDYYGGTAGWTDVTLNIPNQYLTSDFGIGFYFYSDSSITYEGVYIDNVVLEKNVKIGNLDLTIKNVSDSTNQDIPGNNGYVYLYDSDWNVVKEGSTTNSKVSFSNLETGWYKAEAQHLGPFGEYEYWGMKGNIYIYEGSNSYEFTRNEPAGYVINLYKGDTYQVVDASHPITLGEEVRAEVTVKNYYHQQKYIRAAFIADRDENGPYDISPDPKGDNVNAGQTKKFTFKFTPSTVGTYYRSIKVYIPGTNSGEYTLTDSWDWSGDIVVNSPPKGGLDVTVNNYSGSGNPNVPDSNGSVRLFDILGNQIGGNKSITHTGNNQGTVQFTDIPTGSDYTIKIYQYNSDWVAYEYWGTKTGITILENQQNPVAFTRDEPVGDGIEFKDVDNGNALVDSTHPLVLGHRVEAKVKIKNLKSSSIDNVRTTVKLREIGNILNLKSETSEAQTLPVSQDSTDFKVTLTPTSAGNYERNLAIYAYSEAKMTDAWGWTNSFEVVNNPPNKPINLSPANGLDEQSLDATVSWQRTTDPDGHPVSYEVYRGTAENNLIKITDVAQTPVGTNPSYIFSDLIYDQTYYWQIIAKDYYGATTAGDKWSFTTIPNDDPTLTDIYVIPTTITTADDISFQVKYTDEEGDMPDYVRVNIDGGGPGHTYNMESFSGSPNTGAIYRTNIGKLSEGNHNYYIETKNSYSDNIQTPSTDLYVYSDEPLAVSQVKTLDSSGTEKLVFNEGEVITYRVITNRGEDPITVRWENYQSDGTPNIPLTNERTYTGVPNQTTFDWSPDHSASLLPATFTFKGIVNGTSQSVSYRINSKPNSFNNLSPVDEAVDQDANTTNISWQRATDPDLGETDNLIYEVYRGITENNLVKITDVVQTAVGTNPSYPFSNLEEKTTYYWQIIAKDSYGATTTGDKWSFTTEEKLKIIDSKLSVDSNSDNVSVMYRYEIFDYKLWVKTNKSGMVKWGDKIFTDEGNNNHSLNLYPQYFTWGDYNSGSINNLSITATDNYENNAIDEIDIEARSTDENTASHAFSEVDKLMVAAVQNPFTNIPENIRNLRQQLTSSSQYQEIGKMYLDGEEYTLRLQIDTIRDSELGQVGKPFWKVKFVKSHDQFTASIIDGHKIRYKAYMKGGIVIEIPGDWRASFGLEDVLGVERDIQGFMVFYNKLSLPVKSPIEPRAWLRKNPLPHDITKNGAIDDVINYFEDFSRRSYKISPASISGESRLGLYSQLRNIPAGIKSINSRVLGEISILGDYLYASHDIWNSTKEKKWERQVRMTGDLTSCLAGGGLFAAGSSSIGILATGIPGIIAGAGGCFIVSMSPTANFFFEDLPEFRIREISGENLTLSENVMSDINNLIRDYGTKIGEGPGWKKWQIEWPDGISEEVYELYNQSGWDKYLHVANMRKNIEDPNYALETNIVKESDNIYYINSLVGWMKVYKSGDYYTRIYIDNPPEGIDPVELSIIPTKKKTGPGEPVDHYFIINNFYGLNYNNYYNIDLDKSGLPEDWVASVDHEEEFSILPFNSKMITLTVTPPDDVTELESGTVKVTVNERACNQAGGSCELKSYSQMFITRDDPPPIITTNNGENYTTNNPNLTLEGTAISLYQQVLANGSTYGVDYNQSTGKWSYAGTLSEGENTFSVIGKTAAGSESDPANIKITLDTQAPMVSVTPASGTYGQPQTVTLSSDDPSAKIYYTTDGTDPSEESSIYTDPLTISETTTLKYFAIDLVGNSSGIKTENYIIDPNMVFEDTAYTNTGAGYVTSATVIWHPKNIVDYGTITEIGSLLVYADSGLGVYTVDIYKNEQKIYSGIISGYYPWTNSLQPNLNYLEFDVIKFVITSTGRPFYLTTQNVEWFESSTELDPYLTIKYKADTQAPIISVSPPAGLYESAQQVTLSTNESATIYYTTDGLPPTTDSAQYSNPIIISQTTTLKYFAKDAAGNISEIETQQYTIEPINLSEIREPSFETITQWQKENSGFSIDQYSGWKTDGNYSLRFSKSSATNTSDYARVSQQVDLTNIGLITFDVNGAYGWWENFKIYVDSQEVFSQDTRNRRGEQLNQSVDLAQFGFRGIHTIKFIFSISTGGGTGVWLAIDNIRTTEIVIPLTVSATPSGGTYDSIQQVTLTSNRTAAIYYTTDGSDPTEQSTIYTQPITINQTTTLKFFAKDQAGNTSDIKTENYTIIQITHAAQVTIYPKTINANPGQTVEFMLTIKNTGTVRDQFAIISELTPPGTISSPQYIYLDSNKSSTLLYSVKVPDVWTFNPIDYLFTVKVFLKDNMQFLTSDQAHIIVPGIQEIPKPVITTNGGQDFATNNPKLFLEGTKANYVEQILVNGSSEGVTLYRTSEIWSFSTTLTEGVNQFEVAAKMNDGKSSDPINITVILDSQAPVVSVNPAGGNYNKPQLVFLSSNEAAKIYYTVDGSIPTDNSFRYQWEPLQFDKTTTLRFIAIDSIGNQSEVKTEIYNIDLRPRTNLSLTSGWQTISVQGTITDLSIFGSNVEIKKYNYAKGFYENVTEMNPYEGYWIKVPESRNVEIPIDTISLDSVDTLYYSSGFQLLSSFWLEHKDQLKFRIGNETKTFQQVLDAKWFKDKVYYYENNQYNSLDLRNFNSDQIKGKSFWLRTYKPFYMTTANSFNLYVNKDASTNLNTKTMPSLPE